MARDSSWRASLKDLASARAGLAEIFTMPDYIKNAEDRIAGLIASTDVEDGLEGVIRSNCIELSRTEENELFSHTAPLGPHGIRIKYGYAFGIFGKNTRDDLEIIRLVRNVFAHSRKAVWFDTEEIAVACSKLTAIERAPSSALDKFEIGSFERPRNKFLVSCELLANAFARVQFSEMYEELNAGPTLPLN